MATLKLFQYSEMPPRRKIRYFQFAYLRMARLMYAGPNIQPGVSLANTITATQYQALERVYHKPFWKSASTSVDLLPYAKAGDGPGGGGGSGYHVGDILTLVQTGSGNNAKVVVARIGTAANGQQGAVTAVLPLLPGTGYKPGQATVTSTNASGGAGTGTGAIIGLRPTYGLVVDILDQIRLDMQAIAANQTAVQFGPVVPQGVGDGLGLAGGGGVPTMLANYSEANSIKDWGNPKTTLKWLCSASAAASIGSPSAFSGSYQVGQLCTNAGKTYMAYKANSTTPGTGLPGVGSGYLVGTAPFWQILTGSTGNLSAATATDANWVVLPYGGTNNAAQLLSPVGCAIASMIGRLAAIQQGLI